MIVHFIAHAEDLFWRTQKMEEGKFSRFLHGILKAKIVNASPYNPSSPCSCICPFDKPAYVTIELGKTLVAETTHETDRIWNQTFRILCAHPPDSVITITLRTKLSVLGRIQIPAYNLLNEDNEDLLLNWSSLPLLDEKGRPMDPKRLWIRILLSFRHAESEPSWGAGLGKNGDFRGLVDGVTFQQRTNCRVILYQDAHHRSSFRPPVRLRGGGGMIFRPRRLWEDVYRAIEGARNLVYIAGWSFNPNLVLVRDPDTDIKHAVGVKLGELLKRKADEGVAVRVMLWDDETSLHFIKNQGVMNTHDEDAFSYFQHTKVICRLCPKLDTHSFPALLFAHHQKTITVDVNDHKREIISFVGGLDLHDGRYDTEEHSLFRTLDKMDFYQTSIGGGGASFLRGGPREPWHDVHACVAGAAARDVLGNFEQRWRKQCDPSLLVSVGDISDLVITTTTTGSLGDGLYDWNVQVFRSIDDLSTDHLPLEHVHVEHSIHDAYVEAIRRAERFIYIENQYFMGGCHLWDKDQNSGCRNLIPVEIALKIASKIRAGERFAVYIVIPMWPEGVPESDPVMDMLHWTRLTMAMMYKLVGEALMLWRRKKKSRAVEEEEDNGHPKDYLNFFCLANREEKLEGEFVPPFSPPHHNSQYWKAQRNRRFMIYVHSKLLIVDDEYLLIGSANVNQRSMDGKRDTEIGIGCHQPQHVGRGESRYGDIHAYRMSLWYEHTGGLIIEEGEDQESSSAMYREAESVECVRRLREIGEEAWRVYSGDKVVDMGGVHLVSYPVGVSEDGSINEDGGRVAFFPDTSMHAKGRRSILPPLCTT